MEAAGYKKLGPGTFKETAWLLDAAERMAGKKASKGVFLFETTCECSSHLLICYLAWETSPLFMIAYFAMHFLRAWSCNGFDLWGVCEKPLMVLKIVWPSDGLLRSAIKLILNSTALLLASMWLFSIVNKVSIDDSKERGPYSACQAKEVPQWLCSPDTVGQLTFKPDDYHSCVSQSYPFLYGNYPFLSGTCNVAASPMGGWFHKGTEGLQGFVAFVTMPVMYLYGLIIACPASFVWALVLTLFNAIAEGVESISKRFGWKGVVSVVKGWHRSVDWKWCFSHLSYNAPDTWVEKGLLVALAIPLTCTLVTLCRGVRMLSYSTDPTWDHLPNDATVRNKVSERERRINGDDISGADTKATSMTPPERSLCGLMASIKDSAISCIEKPCGSMARLKIRAQVIHSLIVDIILDIGVAVWFWLTHNEALSFVSLLILAKSLFQMSRESSFLELKQEYDTSVEKGHLTDKLRAILRVERTSQAPLSLILQCYGALYVSGSAPAVWSLCISLISSAITIGYAAHEEFDLRLTSTRTTLKAQDELEAHDKGSKDMSH